MAASQTANELLYIYEIVRRLKGVQMVADGDESSTSLRPQIFPTSFLLKLLEERLTELQQLADQLVSSVLERFAKTSHQHQRNTVTPPPELDQFFHHALYQLHNFFLELNWHQANFADHLTRKDQEYTRSKLPQTSNFLLFQRALDESNVRFRLQSGSPLAPQDTAQPVHHNCSSSKNNKPKSSLSLGSKLNSPGRKRRVRFNMDQQAEGGSLLRVQEVSQRQLKESHSVSSLDLILYAINLLTESLCHQLNLYDKSKSQLRRSVELLMSSRKRIRSNQLTALATDIKSLNSVYLGVLSCLWQVFTVQLNKQVARVLYGGGGAINNWRLEAYAERRIQVFSRKVVLEVERKVLSQLASQFLQLMLDLIVSEMNLPPVELDGSVKNKSPGQVERSRENFLSFLTSWLQVDTPGQELEEDSPSSTMAHTGAAEAAFKSSSSRILNQMSNLEHLMAVQLWWLTERLSGCRRQLVYLLRLIQQGLNSSFERLSAQVSTQLSSVASTTTTTDQVITESLNKSVDSISARVRHLKCVHIFGSLDKLIRDMGAHYGLEELSAVSSVLESRLKELAGGTGTGTGSSHK